MAFRPNLFPALAALAAFALLAVGSSLTVAQALPQGAQAVEAGRQALARRDGIAAEIDLRRAVAAGIPENEVSALMGEAYLLQGDLASARHWLSPGNFTAERRQHGFHLLALLEVAEGDFDAAEAAFGKALEGNGGTAEIWVDIGRMRYSNGQQHLALAASLQALRVDPKNPRALEFRGQLERDSRGLVAALPWFEKGLERVPDDLPLLGEYAATLGELGRAKDMLRVTRRMIELDGENARAFYLQAVLAARAGNYNLARRLMWRTNGRLDGVPAAMLLEGILEMEAGNWALAVQALDELARRQPDNMRVARLFGRALLENGNSREVIDRYGSLADRQPASTYILTLVGRAYESLGDRMSAASYLDRAALPQNSGAAPLSVGEDGELAIFRWGDDPYRLDAAIARIRKLLAQDRDGEAAAITAQLAQRYDGSSDLQVLAGDIALARGDAVSALGSYRSAAQIRRSFSLVERMVEGLRILGQDAGAISLVADYLAQHPGDGNAARLLASMLAEQGDWRRASQLALGGRDTQAIGRDPALFAMLARFNLELGEENLSVKYAQAAYAMQRANGSSALVLAQALQRSGRSREAEILFAKANVPVGEKPR